MRQAIMVSVVGCCLWSGGLHAQPAADHPAPPLPLPAYCMPRYLEELQFRRDELFKVLVYDRLAEGRAAEAPSIEENPEVLRYHDALYLALDNTELVVLTDCPGLGNGSYRYLYQSYDSVGHFYVVRIDEYEDSYYGLLSKRTGLLLRVFSLPMWSPTNEYFAHGRCEAMNGPDRVSIVRPVPEGFVAEATVDLPCSSGNCQFSWESPTALFVKCKTLTGFVTLRVVRDVGTWQVESK